jgi:hypothetical protein
LGPSALERVVLERLYKDLWIDRRGGSLKRRKLGRGKKRMDTAARSDGSFGFLAACSFASVVSTPA